MKPRRDSWSDWQSRFVIEMPTAVALFDHDLRYRAASLAWGAAFGLSHVPLAGHRHDEVCRVARDALTEVQRRALIGEAVEDYEGIEDEPSRRSSPILSAHPHRDLDGMIAGVIVAARQARPPAGAAIAAPPLDPLTGLAERGLFVRRLREILADPDPEGRAAVVIAINLDNFRSVNTLHGVGTGDQVLRLTAERLASGTRSPALDERAAARGEDLAARLGGDEFAIICRPAPASLAEAEAIAARLLASVENPISLDGVVLRLTASVGFVMITAVHRDADDVLRDLDVTLQRAKLLGPSKVVAWKPSLTTTATGRYSLADQLRQAFDSGEFVLHYQPIMRLGDNRMVGAEALLRWNHPSEGLVASAAFVPALEETGLIVEVGNWVIREVVRQIESWHELYGRDVIGWVSVNVSARQFSDAERLVAMVRAIHEGGFAVHRLKLEIAEAALVRNPGVPRGVLAELHELGLRVAIDDFGTGYSSLNSLRDFAIDTIKIDGEFVARIGIADGDKLLRALLDIAQIYTTQIVAEGIETAAQRDFLHANGCGFGQGYLFAEPMAGAQLGAFALTHAVNDRPGPGRTRAVG